MALDSRMQRVAKSTVATHFRADALMGLEKHVKLHLCHIANMAHTRLACVYVCAASQPRKSEMAQNDPKGF